MACSFKKVTLNSGGLDTSFRYEYFLGWLSPDGGVRTWFFTSPKNAKETSLKFSAVHGIDGGRSFLSSKDDVIVLEALNLNNENFDYVKSIMESNYVFIIGKGSPDNSKKTLVQLKDGKIKEGLGESLSSIKVSFILKDNFTLNR